MENDNQLRIAVVGLGYVGLPLAVALAKRFETYGFDIDSRRIFELKQGRDRTGEVDHATMSASPLNLTDHLKNLPACAFYIVTVPTPIDAGHRPDLTIVKAATLSVGSLLAASAKGGHKPVIIFESTVYPGVTEEICVPILEQMSGLKWGVDFFVGYSPERINPGDREHTIDKITKVVSGDTPETLDRIAKLYDSVTTGGTFRAKSIKVAEAAKVIENAQRDINVAFMNEVTTVFNRLGVSIWDVLSAARTKWNFLPFTPGLVGGHCIGVDPYYLSYCAQELGLNPKIILAGRETNDGMAAWIAERIHSDWGGQVGKVLVLGVTFKENVPDLRNSKVFDLISSFAALGHLVTVHDPEADPEEAAREYGLSLTEAALEDSYDIVVLAVSHLRYLEMGSEFLQKLVKPGGMLADLKGELKAADCWTF